MMNILRLVRMLYSKRFIKEVMIIVQIMLLVCVYNLASLPFDDYNKNKSFVSENFDIDFDNDLIFSPSLSLGEGYMTGDTMAYREITALMKEEKNLLYACVGNAAFELDNSTMIATVNAYSDAMFDSIKFDLKSKPDESLLQDGEVAVYISSNLSEFYSVGDKITLRSFQRDNDVNITCRVTGILKENADVIAMGNNDKILVHTLSDEEKFIVGKYDEAHFGKANIYPGFIVKGNADTLSPELKSLAEMHGTLKCAEDAFKTYFLKILDENEWNVMILILLLIVIVFGYGGYLIVGNMQKRKLCSIFYICGMNLRKMTVIHILSGLMLFVPGIASGLLLTPYLMENFAYTQFTKYSFSTVVLIVAVLAFSLASSILFSIVQTKKVSAIELYKTTD